MGVSDHERFAANPKAIEGRCRWKVFNNWHSYQCSRKASVDGLWCKQHSPEATKKRKEQSRSNYEAWSKEQNKKWALEKLKGKALDALREIAKGELNDPVSYAQLILEERE